MAVLNYTSYSNSPLSSLISLNPFNVSTNWTSTLNSALFTMGRMLSNSNSYLSKILGLQMVENALNFNSNQNLIPINSKTTNGESDIDLKTEDNKTPINSKTQLLINTGLETANSLLPNKREYNGVNGGITQSLDSAYDTISSGVSAINPLAGSIMKGGALLGKGLNALGLGTDSMTKTDAILGSSFLNLTPIGLVNSIGAKHAHKFDLDEDTFSKTNGSYDNFSQYALSALDKSNKKYGLFSNGARKRANKIIDAANTLLNIMKNIVQEGELRSGLQNLMSAIDSNLYLSQLQGGYDPNTVRIGRHGMHIDLLQKVKSIIKALKGTKLDDPSKSSLSSESVKDYVYNRFPVLKNISFELLNDNNFLPRRDLGDSFGDIEYMTSKHDDLPYYNNYKKPDEYQGKSVIVYNNNVIGEDVALDALSHGLRELDSYWNKKIIPSLKREWDDYIFNEGIGRYSHKSPQEWKSLSREEKDAIIENFYKSEDYDNIVDGLVRQLLVKPELRKLLRYSDDLDYINSLSNTNAWKQALDYINTGKIPQHKKGGSIIELISETTISLVNPLDVPEFQNGGSINVIPDGALHARKHNMDLEGITPKGIPVVSEKDNGKVEQLAEIEKEEVIFRLEVTQKLEELEKKYYRDETSQKEKDECALEAGKLITEELLHNTKDNAGLL